MLIQLENDKIIRLAVRVKKRIRMETRKLGNSDIKITPVGFGAWALGGAGWGFCWGPQDGAHSPAAGHRPAGVGGESVHTPPAPRVGPRGEKCTPPRQGGGGPPPPRIPPV